MICGCLTFSNGDYTGAGRMGVEIARGLRASGHKVIAVCGPRPPLGQPAVADILRAEGVIVYEWDGFGCILDLRLVWRLRSLFVSERVSYACTFFVTTDTRHAGLAAVGLGIPVISSVQIEPRFYGGGAVRQLMAMCLGLVYRHLVFHSLCPSGKIIEILEARFRVPRSRMQVVPNAIDVGRVLSLSESEISEVRGRVGIADNEFMLVNVGRLDEQKGQMLLLEAVVPLLRRRSDVRLVLIGDVSPDSEASLDYRRKIGQFIANYDLGVQVRLVGWRNDVMRLLAAADAFVHAALWEGLPLSVLEAMASGCCSIFTDCAGEPEGFVQGINGFMTKAGDVLSLRGALEEVLDLEAGERRQIGVNAMRLIQHNYEISAVVSKYVETCNAAADSLESSI